MRRGIRIILLTKEKAFPKTFHKHFKPFEKKKKRSHHFKMNMVESLEQLSSASGKKKKQKKQQFNDGMVDAGDPREARKPAQTTTGLVVAVMYNVLIFMYAYYTKNYLVMMLVIAIWLV